MRLDPYTAPPQAEAAARRFAFLAHAGAALSSSLDYEFILQQVARLAIPTLADLCIVDVVEQDGLRRVAIAHVDPTKEALLEQLRRDYPPGVDSPQPGARVIRSGAPELLEEVTAAVRIAHAQTPEHAAIIERLGIRSHLAVPLISRGEVLGAISLGITESDRRYDSEDAAFAMEVARLAALAMDNARLHERVQRELDERRRADAARRVSEERFAAVMDQSPLSVQIFDISGRPIAANRAWEELWGVTLADIPEYNLLTDAQLEARGIAPLIRRAFAGEVVQIPAIRYDPNETLPERSRYADPVRWVGAVAYPVKDADGAVREVVVVHQDVTAARQAEERVRKSEERLRLALAAAHMNVWDWDLATDRVECSENAREFWGIDVGQSADFMKAVHPDDLNLVASAATAAIECGDSYELEYRLRDAGGHVRWVQSRGRIDRNGEGKAVRMVGVTADFTGLKQAETATRLLADAGATLGASLDYHSTLQSLAHVLVPRLADWFVIDLVTETGGLERVSIFHPDPARVALAADLAARFPARPDEPYGAWHVIKTGEPEWAPAIGDEILQAIAHSSEHLEILRGLQLRSYVCVPLIAAAGPIGVLSLVFAESGRRYTAADVELAEDVGRRAAAAVENARLYQRLRAEDRRKDEFLAMLAHELRNPLAPIRTGLELLRHEGLSDRAEKTRQIMDRQLGHMVRLIDDLLDLSRITRDRLELHREQVDLATIVNTALEASRPAIEAAGVQLTVQLPDTPVALDADRTRLAQVFNNILNNAAKFTGRGGRIDLSAARHGDEVEVRVADTGVGIPREMLAQVFEMFAQVSRADMFGHGLGIGLTLVRRLVEMHGGRVWAESDGVDRGATFVVRLPLAEASAAIPAPTPEPPASPASRRRRVLVVDDNADAADTLGSLLSASGHDVLVVHTGPAALAALEVFTPEIAFLDIGLAGMNGYELARRLRADDRVAGITLVAVTGWGQKEDRRLSQAAGFDHHLTKPVDPREIEALASAG